MLKYLTFLGKLAGRIGTFGGPVLARGPEFGGRCTMQIYWVKKHSIWYELYFVKNLIAEGSSDSAGWARVNLRVAFWAHSY